MFNKKDKALVQFADGKQAQLGMTMTYDSSVLLLLLWYIEIFEQIKMNEWSSLQLNFLWYDDITETVNKIILRTKIELEVELLVRQKLKVDLKLFHKNWTWIKNEITSRRKYHCSSSSDRQIHLHVYAAQ